MSATPPDVEWSVGHVERTCRAQVGQSAMSNGRVQLNRSGRSDHSVRSCQWVRSIGPLRSMGHVGQSVISARSARSVRSATSVSFFKSVGHVGQLTEEAPAALVQRGCSQGCASSFHAGIVGLRNDLLPRFMLESLDFARLVCLASC